MDGPVETAKQNGEVSVLDERKIDQVVSELDRYCVVVGSLQKTRWFGSEVYCVGESVVLTTGRDVVPGGDEVRRRGEGVAIVLSGEAVRAWKEGGSRWKAWSSRLVSANLKVGNGSRDRLHILSCYAPTFAASRKDKNIFYTTLQDALSAIPSDECFVKLGDFNARVGSRDVHDEWWHERGPHGHPKSRNWHCIDYVIMRQVHRRKCLDVSVMHGADYNTDHRRLKANLVVGRRRYFRRCSGGAGSRGGMCLG